MVKSTDIMLAKFHEKYNNLQISYDSLKKVKGVFKKTR